MDYKKIANDIRIISIKAIHAATSGHPGGSFSIAEILTALYFKEMNIRPDQPDWGDRDRFILSKGHACPALYAAMALRGNCSEEDALSLRKIDSIYEGHPDAATPGIDAPSGSLGMGLSQGIGMALGARYQKKDFRTYVILGDGDMQEGNTWEALMSAGFMKLDNIVAIYDENKIQGDDFVENQMDMGSIRDKLTSFGWHYIKCDGHDLEYLFAALDEARNTKGKPTLIHADTIKGKGVSFMEGVVPWHGSVTMTDQQLADSLAELEGGNQ